MRKLLLGFGVRPLGQCHCRMHYTGLFSRSLPTNAGVAVYVGKLATNIGRVGKNLVP